MVSIIIPSYNRKDSIIKSVNSVLEQTYSDIEVIVVDDCSTDGTEDVVKSIKNNKLKYIKCSENRGVATARNIGLENAKGRYIAFNDSDDIWKKNKLELQMRKLENNSDYGMVYCAFSRKRGEKILYNMPSIKQDRNDLSGKMFDFLIRGNVIGTPTMVLKREVFDVVGNFRMGLRRLDDYEFILRVANKFSIGYVDEVLVDTYELDDSINVITENNAVENMLAHMVLYEYWKKEEISEENKQLLFEYLVSALKNFDQKQLETYSEKLIPRYFSSEKQMISMYIKEKIFCRNQFKDDIMRKIFSEKIEAVVRYVGDRKIAIYGNGYVGKCLYYLLKKNDIQVECLIDQKVKEEEYLVVDLDNLIEDVKLIILTVYDPVKKIEMNIKRRHPNKEVMNISEIFTPLESETN